MTRRAANALRFLAVCYVLHAITSVVTGILRDVALAKLRDPDDAAIDSHAIIDHLQSLMRMSWFTHVGFVAANLVGIVVLATSLERGRTLASVAIALLLAYLGFSIYEQLEPSTDPGLRMKAMWILSGAVFGVAGMLPLVAAARAVPGGRHAGLPVGGGIALMVVPTVLDAFLILADISSAGTQWLYRGVDMVYTGWFVAFGVVLARALHTARCPLRPRRRAPAPRSMALHCAWSAGRSRSASASAWWSRSPASSVRCTARTIRSSRPRSARR